MSYLGLDTAQANLGVSLLDWKGDELCPALAHTFDNPRGPSDFATNARVVAHLRDILAGQTVEAAALEAPAYSFRRGMVSIGTVHGVLCQLLIDLRIPFLYLTPNKVKYLCAGPAKGGAHPKSVVIAAVRAAYGKRAWDSNMADATVCATAAYIAHEASFEPKAKDAKFASPWREEWARLVMQSDSKDDKGRKAGVFHRPNEFLWRPSWQMNVSLSATR